MEILKTTVTLAVFSIWVKY